MLQDGGPLAAGIGYWPAVGYIVFKALVAIMLWGAAAIGYLFGRVSPLERLWAFAAAALLIAALPATDEIGFAAVAAFLAWHFWRTRSVRTAPA